MSEWRPGDRCADQPEVNRTWRCSMHPVRTKKITPWSRVARSEHKAESTDRTTNDEEAKPPGWILQHSDVQKQIDRAAFRLSRRCGHTKSDLEDIKQDICLHLLMKESGYDPSRGTVGAYVCCVLKSWLLTRMRYLQQQRRKGRMRTRPLIQMDDPPQSHGADLVCRALEETDLTMGCLSRLSSEEIRLLRLAIELTQVHAAETLAISRRQFRHQLRLIRETCNDLDPFSE